MKKWIIAAVATAGLASPAYADSFGVRLGYPLGVQYTNNNTFGAGTGLRLAVNLPFAFSSVAVQADALLGRLPLGEIKGLELFYGAGAHAYIGFGGVFSGGFGIGAQGTVGLEYGLTPQISIGTDVSGGVTYWFNALGLLPYYGGALFVNFKI